MTKREMKNVFLFNCYLSDKQEEIFFESKGESFSSNDQSEKGDYIKSSTLDELVYNYEPTFIKVNCEGSDLDVVKGAKKIIQKYMPVLAVQGHHKYRHLYEIVETINEYGSSQYDFYLRNYMGITEFTFYAIPHNRLADSND